MKVAYAKRQITALVVSLLAAVLVAVVWQANYIQPIPLSSEMQQQYFGDQTALEVLDQLEVKGRAPKTGYSREQFGAGWDSQGACDMRNIILKRDLVDTVVDEQCRVQQGVLNDPYTGEVIQFKRGAGTSQQVQIDHVVALSDAWQKGAQALSVDRRVQLANDPLNLLAVSGPANQQKGDGDAATWLPANNAFRCQYVARQIAVKKKYQLWVTIAEKQAIIRVWQQCGDD